MRREKDRRISTPAKPCRQPPELQIYELLWDEGSLLLSPCAAHVLSPLQTDVLPSEREKRKREREQAGAGMLSADVNQDFSLGLTCQSCRRRIHEFSSWIVSIIKQENCEVWIVMQPHVQ